MNVIAPTLFNSGSHSAFGLGSRRNTNLQPFRRSLAIFLIAVIVFILGVLSGGKRAKIIVTRQNLPLARSGGTRGWRWDNDTKLNQPRTKRISGLLLLVLFRVPDKVMVQVESQDYGGPFKATHIPPWFDQDSIDVVSWEWADCVSCSQCCKVFCHLRGGGWPVPRKGNI